MFAPDAKKLSLTAGGRGGLKSIVRSAEKRFVEKGGVLKMSRSMYFMFKKVEYAIDYQLGLQLMSLCENLKADWDFVILITGDRMVRVGKSVLAMTICAFMASYLQYKGVDTDYGFDDLYFDNKQMMSSVQQKPKFSINHYDEGREGLAASKAMKSFQQDLMDFFAECGQLNHLFVIVAPDFFELKEEIAVGRSEFLLNVYRKENRVMKKVFVRKSGRLPFRVTPTEQMPAFNYDTSLPITMLGRGHFEFFSRKSKARLFDLVRSTRKKNYGFVKAEFVGDFVNQYALQKEEYISLKAAALSRFDERKKEQLAAGGVYQKRNLFSIKHYVYVKHVEEGKPYSDVAVLAEKELGLALSLESMKDYVRFMKQDRGLSGDKTIVGGEGG